MADAAGVRVVQVKVGFENLQPTGNSSYEGIGARIERRFSGSAGLLVSYTFSKTIDDAAMEITDVVRAEDLLSSTARQILLMKLLGYEEIPRYAHVPLVVAHDGERLAKRAKAATIRELRDRGMSRDEIVGTLAAGLGLIDEERAIRWLSCGAQPSDTARALLKKEGILDKVAASKPTAKEG